MALYPSSSKVIITTSFASMLCSIRISTVRCVLLIYRLKDICEIGPSTTFAMKLENEPYMKINKCMYLSSRNWGTIDSAGRATPHRAAHSAYSVWKGIHSFISAIYSGSSAIYTVLSRMYKIPSIPDGDYGVTGKYSVQTDRYSHGDYVKHILLFKH